MERRLQERCAELQRDVFRLQSMYNADNYGALEKRPVALPRQVPPQNSKTNGSSEQEDEGISSSDTGQSLSSESESMLVVNLSTKKQNKFASSSVNTSTDYTINDDETVRIEDVIEELENVVNVASRELNAYTSNTVKSVSDRSGSKKEKEIVPVNLLPQPPKRSRSLVHLLSSGSEFDGSEYGMLLIPNDSGQSFCNDINVTDMKIEKFARETMFAAEPIEQHKSTTNREILDEIMDAHEKESPMPPFITGERLKKNEQVNPLLPYIDGSSQKFDGVFFMSEMGTSRKYSKSDLMAAFDNKRAAKNVERIESFESAGIDSIIDIVVTNDKQQKSRSTFDSKVSTFMSHANAMNSSTFFIGSKALSAENNNALKSIGSQSFMVGSKLTDLPSGLY